MILELSYIYMILYFSKDEVFVVGVVEITIPWDGRVEAARAEKRQTYSPLVEALSGKFLNENQIIIILLPNILTTTLAH